MARLPVFYDPRGDGCLRPASKAAAQTFADLPPRDRLFIATPKKPRNGKAHAMYWALCQYIANALNDGPVGVGHVTAERVSDRIKIATGHCEMVKLTRADAARSALHAAAFADASRSRSKRRSIASSASVSPSMAVAIISPRSGSSSRSSVRTSAAIAAILDWIGFMHYLVN